MELPPGYLSVSGVARHLSVSRQTIYRWLELGLPSHQPAGERGRRLFKISEVDQWIADSPCSSRAAVGEVCA